MGCDGVMGEVLGDVLGDVSGEVLGEVLSEVCRSRALVKSLFSVVRRSPDYGAPLTDKISALKLCFVSPSPLGFAARLHDQSV